MGDRGGQREREGERDVYSVLKSRILTESSVSLLIKLLFLTVLVAGVLKCLIKDAVPLFGNPRYLLIYS